MKKLAFVLLFATSSHADVALPSSWYQQPEHSKTHSLPSANLADPGKDASNNVDNLFQADLSALDQLPAVHSVPAVPAAPTSDVVPWHVEYFINDLAVSTQGTVGILTTKGTATVQTFWRRKSAQTHAEPRDAEASTIIVTDQSTPADIQNEIEPVVQTILSTKQMTNEGALRQNILLMTQKLLATASDIPDHSSSHWWLSRLRLDLFVDASGSLTPTLTAAGQAQVRLEWFRLKKKSHSIPSDQKPSGFSEFVQNMSGLLETVSQDALPGTDFHPYQIRVGTGITVKGTVGVATADIGFMIQCYFKRNEPEPGLTPAPVKNVSLISPAAETSKQAYADLNNITYDKDPTSDTIAYQMDANRLQTGLNRAQKMAGFFAKRANDSKNSNQHWKIFELRTLFDLSVSGNLGLVNIAGTPSFEMDFYNEKF